jgi:hypothetical protein
MYGYDPEEGGASQAFAFYTPQLESGSFTGFIEYNKQKAWEIIGASPMMGEGKNILGANASGKAIESMEDIDSNRQQVMVDAAIRCNVELAELMLHTLPPDQKILKLDDETSKVTWADAVEERDNIRLSVSTINYLSKDPEKLQEQITILTQGGFIDQSRIPEVVDMPDYSAVVKRAKAKSDAIQTGIQKAIKEGVYDFPSFYGSLIDLLKAITNEQQRVYSSSEDDEVITRLEAYKMHALDVARANGELPTVEEFLAAQQQAVPQVTQGVAQNGVVGQGLETTASLPQGAQLPEGAPPNLPVPELQANNMVV